MRTQQLVLGRSELKGKHLDNTAKVVDVNFYSEAGGARRNFQTNADVLSALFGPRCWFWNSQNNC